MMTFSEFLHSNNWKKPLLPRDDKVVRKIIRSGQVGGGVSDWRTAQIAPPHQKLMMALARAGARGLSRSEITGLVDLDGQVLEELLAALVRSSEISVYQTQNGQRVYWHL